MSRIPLLLASLFLIATPVSAAVPAKKAATAPSSKRVSTQAPKAKAAAKKVKKAAPAKPQPARAADTAASYYHNAFAAVDAGKTELVETLAAKGADPVLNKVLAGYAMAMPGNDYPFDQLNAFLAQHPHWPNRKGIQMIAEQKLPNAPSNQIAAWFEQYPPLTLVGFYRNIDALDQTGASQKAQSAVRKRWTEGSFNNDEQTAFYARFSSWLKPEDMWARADALLWRNDQAEAKRMAPYLNESDKAVLAARLALANQDSNAASLLSRVPSDAQNDAGLLYQRLRSLVKSDANDEAEEMLLNAPSELGKPEAWWAQRHIVARRAIERKDFALAYRLASTHNQTSPRAVAQAEFLSGWLALRFLNRPGNAVKHFQNLYDMASTPMTRSRAAYWLGRTYEVLGDKIEAEQAYQDAAVFYTTFYGQLATTRIYATPVLTAKSDPPLPENVRKTFMARDEIRAIERLTAIGEIDRARSFFRAVAENSTKRADFILLTEVASKIKRPDMGIQAVKAANLKNMIVQNGGFPVITVQVPNPPEAAFTHALIRQESTFNPDATSSAGARGLMQLMPRTAKDVCKRVGVGFSEARLGEPSYNIQLGTAFVAQQIDRFDGSYILALAGYNAGPGRVRQWLQEFGDPRSPGVDPIDWIEQIPIQETRNYVQRIIESLQVYRAKLAGGNAPLMILNDLRR
jgi:soluble lytic murein transglycosylase